MIETLKGRITASFAEFGKIILFLGETIQSLFRARVHLQDLVYQLYFIGVKSQSVVLITGAFTGMVLCAQTFYQFHKVKMDTATLAGAVGVPLQCRSQSHGVRWSHRQRAERLQRQQAAHAA